MKIKLTFLAFFAAFAVTASAQDYKNSIGIRLGGGYYDLIGASFKTFISTPAALEFNLGLRPSITYGLTDGITNVSVSGAYQHHFPIGNIDGFKWYVGGGAVIAQTFSDFDDWKGVSIGIFPTGGVDYKLKNAPFAFSADVRPTVHAVRTYFNSVYMNGGVTARYVF